MKFKRTVFLTAVVVAMGLLLGASTTQAAEVEVDPSGNAIRITNLEVLLDQGTMFFDVDFINGTGLDIYGSEDNFAFPPEENAIAIVQVSNALNLNNPVPTGASSAGTQQYYIPAIEYFGLWASFGGEFFQSVGGWDGCETDCLAGTGVLQPSDTITYAKFTLAGPPIPPCEGDLNNDGVVDAEDFSIFLVDWNRTDCPVQ